MASNVCGGDQPHLGRHVALLSVAGQRALRDVRDQRARPALGLASPTPNPYLRVLALNPVPRDWLSLLDSAAIGGAAIGRAFSRWGEPMRDRLATVLWPLRRRATAG